MTTERFQKKTHFPGNSFFEIVNNPEVLTLTEHSQLFFPKNPPFWVPVLTASLQLPPALVEKKKKTTNKSAKFILIFWFRFGNYPGTKRQIQWFKVQEFILWESSTVDSR